MDISFLIAILVFVEVVLFAVGIFTWRDYRIKHSQILDRIEGIRIASSEGEARGKTSSPVGGIKNNLLKIFGSLGERVKPKNKEGLSFMRKNLLMAGYRSQGGPVIFFGSKVFMAILLPAIFLVVKLSPIKTPSPTLTTVILVLLALCGFYLPNIWLLIKIDRRKEKISNGFPDAMDLLVVCVESGLGLDAAMKRVGEEIRFSNRELSEEFELLNLELGAGKLRHDALKNLALRTGLDDVNNLVTLLIQTDKFGTSVAQALRVHSEFMRSKRYLRAEEMAAKLPVKILFPVILFIFPSLFVVILGPAMIRIYRLFMHP
jgi:tight adherence protein C